MDSDNRKGKIALTVIGAATLLVAMTGATFAYFSATSKTTTQTVTTSSLNLTVSYNGEDSNVKNIKPTTWAADAEGKVAEANTTNKDIIKFPFKVTGESSSAGTYKVNLQTSIALNNGTVVEEQGQDPVSLTGGEISDIKYRLYKADGTPVGAEQSFAETTNTDIISNGAITANVALDDQYVLYIYISKTEQPQNKLQGINFTVTLGGSASQA